MGTERELIYAVCGEKGLKYLKESIDIVRHNDKDISISLYYDKSIYKHPILKYAKERGCSMIEYRKIPYDKREGNRNNDLWKLKGLKESRAKTVTYLDSDVYIYDWKRFIKGFDIAKRFGILFPMNPRIFVKVELDIGADVTPHDKRFFGTRPGSDCSTAYNMGVIFYSKGVDIRADLFLDCIISEQENYPSRGPMAVQRSMWLTGYAPYTLPVNWLVCAENVGIKTPIALHVGHDKVMEWHKKLMQE
jgi:hypothetical protein